MKEKFIFIFFCFAFSVVISAQEKLGIIEYRGVINQKYVDSFLIALDRKKDITMHVKQIVVGNFRNATPDDFVLNFKNEESYYYHIPILEESYNVGSKAGLNSYYTNNGNQTVIEESPSLGNVAHKSLDWKITQETKRIGKYVCYKAIVTERLYSRRGFYYNKKAVAWFTPEIPVSFGPSKYSGLPGLILQVERDMFTLTATKINLNPNEKDVEIKKIGKGEKIISEEESHDRIKKLTDARKKEYGG
ncbi:GLPGLI family protein [Galbibacter mesophilus]|uniref:GLPGLI family protein n=1 Tax=Galbibacter mesophilus TaxID=379069 RepID=UPI00191F2CFE|nr:GLPGLI family protein [Galbibacter mesophilus]MCM5662586.1 GLPGLI family protein [Galbibacter mesophilus]